MFFFIECTELNLHYLYPREREMYKYQILTILGNIFYFVSPEQDF